MNSHDIHTMVVTHERRLVSMGVDAKLHVDNPKLKCSIGMVLNKIFLITIIDQKHFKKKFLYKI